MPNSKNTKIGYVVKRYPRYSETFIVNEILAHEAAGLELEIFALRPPADTHFQDSISKVRAPVTYLPASGVKIADFWQTMESAASCFPGFWNKLSAAQGEEAAEVFQAAVLAQLIREKGITGLHAHFATSATAVARLASRFADVPYSFTAHAKDIFHESVDPADLKRKFSEAQSVVTVSDFNLDYLQKAMPESSEKIFRIYNGLDLDRFPFKPGSGSTPTILAVGRLVEKKGFVYLVEACDLLRRRNVDFHCRIIGSGEEEQNIRAAIQRHGLKEQVELTGPLPQEQIIKQMQEAAVFAAPCIIGEDGNRDGLPTVLLEAMAVGVPCIATDVTGIPEVVKHNETGLLVAQEDAASLAEGLETLLTQDSLRGKIAANARLMMEEKFNIHTNAASLRELFGRSAAPARQVLRKVG